MNRSSGQADLLDWVIRVFLAHYDDPAWTEEMFAKEAGFRPGSLAPSASGRGRPTTKADLLDKALEHVVASMLPELTSKCPESDLAGLLQRVAAAELFTEQVCRWQFGGTYVAIRKRSRPGDVRRRLMEYVASGMSKAEAINAEGVPRSTGFRLLRDD
jgi:hypothetical protein